MANRSSIFRLYLLGQLSGQSEPLITMAEFHGGRVVERILLAQTQVQELTQNIQDLRGFIEAGYPVFEEPALKRLGSKLFEIIIREKVRDLFLTAAGEIQGDLPLEIFLEDFFIASWPWEYLYDPTKKLFLCQEFYPISRGIFKLDLDKSLSAPKGKINILLVIGALPDDSEATPLEEIKIVQEVFNSYLASNDVTVKILQGCEPIALQKELQTNHYHILHFFGHAGYDLAKKEGYIKLSRPGSEPYRFYANNFGQLLAKQKIRLVFLNACETARAALSETPARSSVAAALVDRGVPAVIATQFSLPDNSSHFLSSAIYNALVSGKSLTNALRDGRQAMTFSEKSQFFDWGIPVLYSSDPEITIFPRSKNQPEPSWLLDFENALKIPQAITALTSPRVDNGPTITVARTVQPSHRNNAQVRVALIDINAKVGFLPDIVEAANQAQDYYDFQVSYAPIPAGTIKLEQKQNLHPYLYLPPLEDYLHGLAVGLQAQIVCYLTRYLISDGNTDDLFAVALQNADNVSVISTFELRKYAREAKVPFAKATLFLSLMMIIAADQRWSIRQHDQTVGCLFDYCNNRDDLVVGLRHMKFDHKKCRDKIDDQQQLTAIDALLALEAKAD
ncbi:MAG: CHAT domain-containing protein [Acidobacteriota bacterium]